MVWSDGMEEWTPAAKTPLTSLFIKQAAPPPLNPRQPSMDDDWERDVTKVYPSNPPKSPQLCWLNLFIVGLSQILLGQVAKGIVILIADLILVFVTGGITFFLIRPIVIVDAFMVGRVLRTGRPVGKWQFFPTGK